MAPASSRQQRRSSAAAANAAPGGESGRREVVEAPRRTDSRNAEKKRARAPASPPADAGSSEREASKPREQRGAKRGLASKEEKTETKRDSVKKGNLSTAGILNKKRRQQVAFQLLQAKKKDRAKKKKENRAKERRGETVEKKVPATIESMRRYDPTVVEEDEEEVEGDEAADEFAAYFNREVTPKLMITTNKRVTADMYSFLKEVLYIFPNAFFYKRGPYQIKNICKFAVKQGFTDLLVFKEKNHRPYGLYIVHLPDGPTSYFRLSSVRLAQEMQGAATMTTHLPELLLNNFTTRLGRRVARQLAALFPLTPEFSGRRVVTFHNQRDFIFFRHHRYIFEDGKRTRLQEIGPRLTLKLLWMHAGLFDTREGLYEFIWRPDMKVDRKNMLI
ncbi:IMP4 family U3 small nucleolar ribonucleoprotein (snoRNP), putative [Toxoplasma gondii ME49]|uniref:IMP4 family U3 small nucleolar ribonucleoprotein (snoRNP), putative n=4 Tax=Toxoplasma gondii TaxID=5811 RepID=A0A125YT54_TOXGM|nr:IMP4 family U3 small nucleolar ribonucleoprotein (snoRNP), putative [Toxoplasma gondii ME49]ESS34535.1 putative IMP4 family U3 small nucleolar ribonucleoprotein (snoRNP) [Toxoplasma gondii VEG]KFG57675.1 putative IMP4 family U3 small nucleolar ribonucleoprotein (snoRNP) [Toxoplasma gondii RUB]PIL97162.1 putative IMP4 family U3 small nucleolar ribonucleoprotein (snoRNP) [Toxoplasma gondii COUG]EPT25225.1 IMP4 family U3 small nucleolar ribonucleoprotein (snoRNP), putative [Toxoplasma gondii ME|eukprot:XP_002367401.1 IMP4 family U3 small nucleolar ribonucleoprotein (snoRNP), putative [Toxoplasma gondii ME49]